MGGGGGGGGGGGWGKRFLITFRFNGVSFFGFSPFGVVVVWGLCGFVVGGGGGGGGCGVW